MRLASVLRWALVAAVAAVAILPPASAAERVTISQYGVVVETLPWAVALERGFFGQQGVDIDGFIGGNGGGTTLRNMMASSLPFAEVAVPAAIAAVDSGIDLKIVFSGVNNTGDLAWVVKKDSPLKSLADLRGKKVAFTAPLSVTEMVLRMILEKQKLDKTVEVIAAGGLGSGLAALDAGGVDAAPVDEPEFMPDDKYRVLFRVTDYLPNIAWEVDVTTAEFAKSHPDVVRKLIAAHRDALTYMTAHPDEAAKVYAKVWNSTDPRFPAVLAHLLHVKYWAPEGLNRPGLDVMIAGMTLVGALTHPVDLNAMIDPQFSRRGRR